MDSTLGSAEKLSQIHSSPVVSHDSTSLGNFSQINLPLNNSKKTTTQTQTSSTTTTISSRLEGKRYRYVTDYDNTPSKISSPVESTNKFYEDNEDDDETFRFYNNHEDYDTTDLSETSNIPGAFIKKIEKDIKNINKGKLLLNPSPEKKEFLKKINELKKNDPDFKSTILPKKRSSTISEGISGKYRDYLIDEDFYKNSPTRLAEKISQDEQFRTPTNKINIKKVLTSTPSHSVHFSNRKQIRIASGTSSLGNEDSLVIKNTKANQKRMNYSTDMSDEESDLSNESPKKQLTINEDKKVEKSLMRRLYSDPEIPLTISLYIQIIINLIIFTIIFGFLWALIWTIWNDINNKIATSLIEITQEINLCQREYTRNNCEPHQRVPALEISCLTWEKCMARDPKLLSKTKIGAETIAEILNGFIKPISWKSLIFISFGLIGSFIMNNYLFVSYQYNPYHQNNNNNNNNGNGSPIKDNKLLTNEVETVNDSKLNFFSTPETNKKPALIFNSINKKYEDESNNSSIFYNFNLSPNKLTPNLSQRAVKNSFFKNRKKF